jgi:hepatocyte growth factor-regulated tyrosine kinase substrate
VTNLSLCSYDVPKTSHHLSNARGSRSKAFRNADTDLHRAIQLSLEDAGVSGGLTRSGYTPSQPPSTVNPTSYHADLDPDNDPDLKAAIEASLLEASNLAPSAPLSADFIQPVASLPRQISAPQEARLTNSLSSLPNYDMDLRESDTIMTFSQTVEQAQHDPNGRDISRYPTLNQLYDQANGLRPKLAMSLDDTSRRESEPYAFMILCLATEPI